MGWVGNFASDRQRASLHVRIVCKDGCPVERYILVSTVGIVVGYGYGVNP